MTVFILAMAGSLWRVRPDIAGFVAGGLWAIFVVTPALLQRRMHRLSVRQKYASAAAFAKVASWLHPFDGLRDQSRLLHALDMSERGETESAVAILNELQNNAPRIARQATLHLCRLRGQWPELVDWVQISVDDVALRRDANLLAIYLRALGETGRVDEMLETLDRHRTAIDSPVYTTARNLCRLYAFAFSGEPERTAAVLRGPLWMMPGTVGQFWIATAELTAGQMKAGEARLLSILPAATPFFREIIGHRLAGPPPLAADSISPAGLETLHELEQERDQEERYTAIRIIGRRPWATYLIIFINIAMFVVEWRSGGTMDDPTLLRLGAFDIHAVNGGEYWRLVTANFLHFGLAHIAMNMIALFVLGPFVEYAVGPILFFALYLLSGMGAIATVWLLQLRHVTGTDVLVGASGAIMAMIGATAAILIRGWLGEKARIASYRLRIVVLILVVQVVFDQMTPQVSGAAHLAGAVWGFVLMLLILPVTKKTALIKTERLARIIAE